MEYDGRYKIFDPEQVVTYPVAERSNKVNLSDLIKPEDISNMSFEVSEEAEDNLTILAKEIVSAREKNRPVVFFTGAHLVKNGLTLLLGDLIKRGFFTLIAGNAATSIHDFELALIGATSEYVPQALEKGQFGMAYEFNYINAALILGNRINIGYGEAIGKLMCDNSFRVETAKILHLEHESIEFKYPEISIQAICFENKIPMTIHAGIGTDVLDQHAFFDGEAKGGCSGRDFLIYANEISELTEGGVVLNVGSAVTGPEVFLKAASMAGNISKTPKEIVTANFDLRHYNPDDFVNENSVGYYYRDQKSIVTRVPQAYGGKGYYVGGNQKQTIPLLYRKLLQLM